MASAAAPPAADQGLPPVAAPDPELKRLRGELDQHKQALSDMATRMSVAPPPPSAPPMDKKNLEKEFFKAPLDFTAQIANNVAQAVSDRAMQQMGSSFDTLKAVARSEARNTDPEIFDKYALEIEAKVASMQPNLHTNIHVWKNALNMVRGEHFRDARPEPTGRSAAVHISTDGGPAGASRSAPAPQAEKLSDDEQLWARRLGLTNDQYLRGKKHYEGQSERGPSSWDSHITFNSKEKRKQQREQRAAAAKSK